MEKIAIKWPATYGTATNGTVTCVHIFELWTVLNQHSCNTSVETAASPQYNVRMLYIVFMELNCIFPEKIKQKKNVFSLGFSVCILFAKFSLFSLYYDIIKLLIILIMLLIQCGSFQSKWKFHKWNQNTFLSNNHFFVRRVIIQKFRQTILSSTKCCTAYKGNVRISYLKPKYLSYPPFVCTTYYNNPEFIIVYTKSTTTIVWHNIALHLIL